MPSKITLMLFHPVQSIIFLYGFFARVLLILATRVLLPKAPRYQSLRIEIQRAYLISTSLNFPDLTFALPAKYSERKAFPVQGPGWKGYLIPGGNEAKFALRRASKHGNCRVVIYAHGGGYARGTARMYVPYMYRWVAGAKERGLDLTFLSLEYTLSTQAPHPKQRQQFLAAYRYLLELNIPPSRILFMGDSAGGGLSINSAIQASKDGLPQPAGSILISPWMDLAMSSFLGGSAAVTSDYFTQANQAVPHLVKIFRGRYAVDDPEINPLYAGEKDLKSLNPQLIFVGAAEFALYDSKAWAEVCRKAKVRCDLHAEWGQLHIWAMGSKWIEPKLRRRTDAKILDWIEGKRGEEEVAYTNGSILQPMPWLK